MVLELIGSGYWFCCCSKSTEAISGSLILPKARNYFWCPCGKKCLFYESIIFKYCGYLCFLKILNPLCFWRVMDEISAAKVTICSWSLPKCLGRSEVSFFSSSLVLHWRSSFRCPTMGKFAFKNAKNLHLKGALRRRRRFEELCCLIMAPEVHPRLIIDPSKKDFKVLKDIL